MSKKMNVVVTGITGMVGEGVMHICLNHPEVASVLAIARKSTGLNHPKLKEIVHADFFDFSAIEKDLVGYDACFFCLGVSSVGMKEPEYYKLTYTLTLHVAETLSRLNKDMTFCYVSGGGTDSTEKGPLMWARVKGKTENDLRKLPFKQVYAFRPGFIKSMPGMQHTLSMYKYFSWLFPVLKWVWPGAVTSLSNMGNAMINTVRIGYEKEILEVKDINTLAQR